MAVLSSTDCFGHHCDLLISFQALTALMSPLQQEGLPKGQWRLRVTQAQAGGVGPVSFKFTSRGLLACILESPTYRELRRQDFKERIRISPDLQEARSAR